MVYNLFHSAEVGKLAGDNPWRSRSPEWQIPSPVPEHSFATPISVVGEPYDYGLANSTYIQMGAAVDMAMVTRLPMRAMTSAVAYLTEIMPSTV